MSAYRKTMLPKLKGQKSTSKTIRSTKKKCSKCGK